MASSYGYIKKGAQGDTVKWLQQQLGIEADGIFGSQTEQAVRDFQKASGIKVDGIVGNETMEHLLGRGTGSAGNSTPINSTTEWLASYEGNRPTYQQSQALIDAANALTEYEGKKPGPYQSSYSDQIQGILDDIMSRGPFSYDFAVDPMYQQYADRYQQQGKLAMQDTMGQAATLTGGYSNSYAQNVGQQAYNSYLQGLNDIIPTLRDAAYQVYRDDGAELHNRMSLLQGLEDTEYSRFRDDVGDYYTDLQYLYNKRNDLSDEEYNRFLTELAAWQDDRDYFYRKQQDEAAMALALQKASGGGRGSGGGGSNGDTASDFYYNRIPGTYVAPGAYVSEPKSGGGSTSSYNRIPGTYVPALSSDDEDMAELAADFHDQYPHVALDSRTVDMWLEQQGVASKNRKLFKEYLKEFSA